jgi:carbonic anhydrase/acetyltransferase-like protein (isoleucine patch superfamily)
MVTFYPKLVNVAKLIFVNEVNNLGIYKYKTFSPKIDESVFLAPGSQVIGRVELFKNVSIWQNTILRGDVNLIMIGENTNIQDLSMLHVTEETDLLIGKNTSVGHSVTLHGCHIGDHSLIGMGSTILDGASIGNQCLVAAGSLVPPGKEYPDGSMIMGSPAKVVRKLTEEEINFISNHYRSYLKYKEEFQTSLEEISR